MKLTHLINLFVDVLFPKYKAVEWATGDVPLWAISVRRWLFFRSPMVHTKVVIYKEGHAATSQEILLFWSKEDVESEVDRLDFGYPPVATRAWKNNQVVETTYKQYSLVR